MQEQFVELSRKYREEMLRMYGKKSVPAENSVMPDDVPPDITEGSLEIPEDEPSPLPEEMAVMPLPPEDDPAFTGAPEDFQNRIDTPFPEEYEDPVIPEYIKNGTPPMMEEGAAEELEEYTENGFLRVATLTGDGAFPVPDAHVTITVRRSDGEHLAYLLITDESGETPTVSLPAPDAALSQSPENRDPFTTAEIRIFAEGYFRARLQNVPIFAGITSVQTVQLIPLPALMHEDQETLTMTSESPDL